MTTIMTRTKVALFSGLLVAMLTVGLATAQACGKGGSSSRGHSHFNRHHPREKGNNERPPCTPPTPTDPTPTDQPPS